MTHEEFRELVEKKIVILDGATGTNLQKAGMPVGVCPEQWILENPKAIMDLQNDFIEAGTDILYAPTFTGNRIKLAEYGLEDRLVEINEGLVKLCKEVAKDRAYVAGDMTMTGRQLYPMGDLSFEELLEVYREQARVLYEAGVDLFVVETMMSLQETRAAVLAIHEVCDLPVMVSLTFEPDGRTLYGTPPEVAASVFSAMGVDALGLNCSTGPDHMVDLVKSFYEYATVPVLVKPNAGLPFLENNETVYKMTPEVFAKAVGHLVEAGARIVGGCCGTTKFHIKATSERVKEIQPLPIKKVKKRILTSERRAVEIALDGKFLVIGERINPTGKKKLQEELREGKMTLVRQMAREQTLNGASILDVNMGTNGIDEKEMMVRSIYEVSEVTDLPLCLDSSYPEVIEAALKIYPGRALINSISCETEKFEQLIPLAKKYGAMFILLPVSDEGIPKTLEEKHQILEETLEKAYACGIAHEDIIVDGLVATVGADKDAAKNCLATFRHCHDSLKLPTVCGLSNISFGLPQRTYANVSFLVMSIVNGLTMAIANPSQDLLMNAAFASDMLLAKPESDLNYINRMQYFANKQEEEERKKESKILEQKLEKGLTISGGVNISSTGNAVTIRTGAVQSSGSAGLVTTEEQGSADDGEHPSDELSKNPVYQGVMQGDKDNIVDFSKAEMAKGKKADAIINDYLIPAINEVGSLYDQKKYFLPQLIASANAMKVAIAYLEPLIEKSEDGEEMASIVIATVEGDVHDIGKNLVALMLRNYGYNVTDLGKDVPAETIIQAAIDKHAQIVGLSALMTTTMMRMKEVVELAKEKGYEGKIIIGGAAVTESFAEEIGADGYSTDAADCVKLVGRLLAS